MKKLLTLIIMFISMGGLSSHADNTDISKYKDVIYIESTEAEAGEQIVLSVKMKNSIEVPGFQFDLYLPDGMSVAEIDGMCDVNLSTVRTSSVKTNFFDSAIQSDGALRVLCNTTKKNPATGKLFCFTGNDGEVCTITVNVDNNIANGNYNIELKSIEISDVNSEPHALDGVIIAEVSVSGKAVLPGDVNCDGKLSIVDLVGIISILNGNTTGLNIDAADYDQNGMIEKADADKLAECLIK